MSVRCESIDINLNKREILKNISIEVNEKEILSIIGPNGAGKSTLLKSLAGDINPINGNIFYDEKNINQIDIQERAFTRSVMSQLQPIAFDFSVKEIARNLKRYGDHLTRQGVKDAMDLYDKLAADGTLDKEVEDGDGFVSSYHVPKLKKAFELIGLYGKGINESVVRKNLKSIITKVLEEEVINEAATNDLAKIADEYDDFGGLKPAVISLQNIVTEIESFYDKTREKIQKVYDSLGNVTNDEGLKVGAFITPAIENAFKRDLKHIIKNQFTGGLSMPQVRRISQDDINRGTVQQEAPKDTVFSPVNEKKNKNEK